MLLSLTAAFLLTVLLLPAWLAPAGASPAWSEPDYLSPETENNEYAQIAVDSAGKAHVVWEEWDLGQIFYASGTPGDWSEQQWVSINAEDEQWAPNVALDPQDNAHVIWEGYDNDLGSYQIWYANNVEGEWSEPERISIQSGYDQGEQDASLRVSQIAVDAGGGIHAAWCGYDEPGDNYQIWYAYRAPGGGWSEPERVSIQSDYEQVGPQMALDPEGVAHIVWEGYDEFDDDWLIWYSDSTGWSMPQMISPDDDGPYYPNIAVDSSGAAHAVWHGHNSEIGYGCDILYATNAGGEWSYPERVSEYYEHSGSYVPDLAVGPDGVPQVVWDGYDYDTMSYYAILWNTKSEGLWGEPVLLSPGMDYDQFDPQMAVDPTGAANVVWYGYDNAEEYYLAWYATNVSFGATSLDAGEWSDPVLISHQEDCDSYDPMIALDRAGNPNVAWDDYFSGVTDEIWYRADIRQRLVTAEAVGSGAVDPEEQVVPIGGDAAVALLPDEGFKVGSLTDNGAPVTPVPQDVYVIEDVQVDHEVVATFVPAEQVWYMPEGCTLEGMETWILVENPGATPARVNLAFDTDQGEVVPPQLQDLKVPEGTRSSFPLSPYIQSYDVATRVTSDSEVVCERATYGPSRPSPGQENGVKAWATESVGTTTLSDTWFLTEGSTQGDFETWLLVQNPNDFPVRVNIALNTEVGRVQKSEFQDLLMPAHTRASWDLSKYYVSYDVAAVVTTEGGPVAAERAMYAPDRAWAHGSVGSPVTSAAWYLAEGCTEGMETWFLVQNPGPNPVKVDVKYLTENGMVQGPQQVLPAYSRRSFNASDTVSSFDVAALITSEHGDVTCDRSMYGPQRAWGTCSVGTPQPADVWFLAEGCTIDMDTWVLVANPGSAAATVNLILVTDSGVVVPPPLQDVTVPAGSRRSFHLNDYVSSYGVSTVLVSDSPVVSERSMYGDGGTWGHCSVGYAPAVW